MLSLSALPAGQKGLLGNCAKHTPGRTIVPGVRETKASYVIQCVDPGELIEEPRLAQADSQHDITAAAAGPHSPGLARHQEWYVTRRR